VSACWTMCHDVAGDAAGTATGCMNTCFRSHTLIALPQKQRGV